MNYELTIHFKGEKEFSPCWCYFIFSEYKPVFDLYNLTEVILYLCEVSINYTVIIAAAVFFGSCAAHISEL